MAVSIYPSLNEIRETHAWKREYERYLPLSRYVFRPLGFLTTWLAIRLGLTSETVSWLSGFVGLIGCLCLMSSQAKLLPVGIALLLFFNLLDCVDGSIARTTKTENTYGRFLDSLMAWIDMGFWGLIGIMAFRHPNFLYFTAPMGYSPIFWLAVGGLTCYLFNILAYVERTFDQYLRVEWDSIKTVKKNYLKDKPKDEEAANHSHITSISINLMHIISRINHNLRVRETHYFLLVFSYCGKIIDLLLGFFLFYYFLHTIFLIIVYSSRGKQVRRETMLDK